MTIVKQYSIVSFVKAKNDKPQEKTLPRELAGGRGEGTKEDSMGKRGAVPPSSIAEKTAKWQEIDKEVMKKCKKKWNGRGDDAYTGAGELFFSRSFTLKNRQHALARAMLFARESLRKEWRWQHSADGVVILPPKNAKIFGKIKLGGGEKEKEPDPRIDTILESLSDPRAKKVIRIMRERGENLVRACRAAGISYAVFRAAAREAYCCHQPRLFGGEA